MALSDYKRWKKRAEILDFLKEFGITEEDLKYLPEALKIVKNRELAPVITEEQKKELEKRKKEMEGAMTPVKFVNSFAGEKEHFRPYGKQ